MLEKLQAIFGVAKGELLSILVLLSIILTSFILSLLNVKNESQVKSIANIYDRLDSISLANATTFVGSNNFGNTYDKLSKGDTVLQKELFFANNKISKELNVSEKINLNKASKVELMKIPGIGEKTALKIIQYRSEKKFLQIEDIMNIKGIGAKKFAKMKDHLDI
ncbi:MAG TPA: helix-hairpin-helix domain-containing protein [Candidatus Kapabacteria bacterium]|nr:helix-hairpin-helix domain-containing protein [Candidatus Kapabacteria bacterium]